MITRQDIEKLANLSRLKLSPEELTRMEGDMGAILAYVDKLKAVTGSESGPVMSVNKNVMREDANPHEGGIYTKKLIDLAPNKQVGPDGSFVKVKKIIGSSQ